MSHFPLYITDTTVECSYLLACCLQCSVKMWRERGEEVDWKKPRHHTPFHHSQPRTFAHFSPTSSINLPRSFKYAPASTRHLNLKQGQSQNPFILVQKNVFL